MSAKLIGYYRVSTASQGKSGLGLEGQKATVSSYATEIGARIIAGYVEVESGTGKVDRPQLADALAHAKFAKATLAIAKMDRLTRNLGFLTRLEDSKVEFIACDQRNANKLTIRIMVMVAEQEAEAVSARTRSALAAYKVRGGVLGASRPECRNLTREAARKGAEASGVVNTRLADEFNGFIAPRIRQLRAEGHTLQAIADVLNGEGVKTRRDRDWTHVQVRNILGRYAG